MNVYAKPTVRSSLADLFRRLRALRWERLAVYREHKRMYAESLEYAKRESCYQATASPEEIAARNTAIAQASQQLERAFDSGDDEAISEALEQYGDAAGDACCVHVCNAGRAR